MYEVKELDLCSTSLDGLDWDKFIETSPQGNLFSNLAWVSLFHKPFKVYVCLRKNEIRGGIVGFTHDTGFFSGGANVPFTPFQGVICRHDEDMKLPNVYSLYDEISTSLIGELEKHYRGIEVVNHYTFPDVRSFVWHDYKQYVRYTYVVDISDLDKAWDNMEKDTRYVIKQAEEDGIKAEWCKNLRVFDDLYTETFKRKDIEKPPANFNFFHALTTLFKGECYMTASSGTFVIKDDKRAYYIFGASDGQHPGASSLCLWHTMKELNKQGYKEIDLVGCNHEKIALFKRGFGGTLKSYLGCIKV